MAKNLQKKLTTTDVLFIQDINAEATKRFADEVAAVGGGAQVKIAASPAEAADGSVSSPSPLSYLVSPQLYVMSLFQFMILSWHLPSWEYVRVILLLYNKANPLNFQKACFFAHISIQFILMGA
jgi:hypothetical protein